jgi:hypothetical protein
MRQPDKWEAVRLYCPLKAETLSQASISEYIVSRGEYEAPEIILPTNTLGRF